MLPHHHRVPSISSRIAAQDGKALERVDGHVLTIPNLVRELDLKIPDVVDALQSTWGIGVDCVEHR